MKLPLIRWQTLEKIYEHCGYEFLDQDGSARSYYHPRKSKKNPAKILQIHIPHKKNEIPRGTLREKIKYLGLTRQEFFKLYRKYK